MLVDGVAQLALVLGELGEAQRTDRQRRGGADLAARHRHQLRAAAAEIADDAAGVGNAGKHAVGGEPSLLLAAEDLHFKAMAPLDLGDEGAPVAGIAHRRRGEDVEPPHRDVARQGDEALQIGARQRHAVGIEPPGGLEVAAEAAHDLLVEQRARRAPHAVIDDEAQRVRADVDHRDGAAPRRSVAAPRPTPRHA